MDKDNKNTELNDTDKKLHISDVSCSIEDIKNWVDENIMVYDPDDCEWKYLIDQAIDDMLYNFKQDFDIEDDETFENEKILVEYFKSVWVEYYN